jgi:hypothetical protein
MADTAIDIRPILDPLQVDQKLKADAWNQFQGASSPEDFQARFDKVNIPVEAKAALWNAKFKPAAPPGAVPPQLTGPSTAPKVPGSPNLPSAQEASDQADANAKAYVASITNPALGQMPGAGKAPPVPGLTAPAALSPVGQFLSDRGVNAAGPDGSSGLAPQTPDGGYHLDEAARRFGTSVYDTNLAPKSAPAGDQPRVDFSKLLPTQEELKAGGASEASRTVVEGVRGLTDVASQLTSFENAIVTKGAGDAGAAAKFAGASTKLIYQGLSAGMAAYFGTEMGKHLVDTYPDLKEAIEKKDWPNVARMVTSDTGQAILVGLAGKHIKDTFASGQAALESGIQEHNAGAEEALVGDMAKGQAQPDPEGLGGDAAPAGPAKGPAAPLPKADVREATFERVDQPQAAKPKDAPPAEPPAATRDLQIHPDSPFHGNDPHEVLTASVEEIGAQRQRMQALQAKFDSGDKSDQTRQDLQYAKDDYEGMHHELEQHFGKEVAGLARTAIEAPDEGAPEPTDEEAAKEAPVEKPQVRETKKPVEASVPSDKPDDKPSDDSAPATLPRDLAGASPRYSYGSKAFTLDFDNDADKAAYITAQEKPSKRDADYLNFGMKATGLSEEDLRDRGRQIRDTIKQQAKGADAGKLTVPSFAIANPSVGDLAALGKDLVAKLPSSPNVRAPNESEIQEAAEIRLKELADEKEKQPAASAESVKANAGAPSDAGSTGSAGVQVAPVREADTPRGPDGAQAELEGTGSTRLPDGSARSAEDGRIAPGTVADVPIGDIHVDAPRFQFKQGMGQGGAGDELRGVTKFDPEKSGILSVWQDPKDGKTYVVNGHHRVELAQRTGAKSLTVRYLDAKTATEARTKGALINIAEGRGESTDAAKVFRDSGMDARQLESEGVSLKGAKAKEGLSLSNLSPSLFDRVVSGDIPAARGAVIGAGLKNHADQDALSVQLEKRERGGKRATNDQIEEMIRLANHGPKVATESAQGGLFGDEQVEHSPIFERAEVSDYIRKQFAGEKRLFSTVGTAAVEKTLGRTGNVIKSGDNAEVAQQAGRSIALYDKLSTHAGPVADAIDQGAKELADGKERPDAVKNRVYEAVRAGLIAQGDSLAGKSGVPAERPQGDAQSGSDQTGSGQRDLAQRVEPTLQERTKTALKNNDVPGLRKVAAEKLAAKKAKLTGAARSLLKDESGTHYFGGKPKAPPPATPLGALGKGVRAKLDKNKALRDFLGDESGTSKVGDVFKADLAEMTALKAKRDAAAEQLKNAQDHPEDVKSADALAESYMANRDLWSTRVNQVVERLRKMVPDPVDQEALSILRDFTKRSDLKQWADGSHPVLHDLDPEARAAAMKNIDRLRPAIERAQNPSPQMLAANDVLTQIAAASAQEAENRGMIEKGLDPQRYFTHLLHPKGEGDVPTPLGERIGKAMGGKIGRRYAFSEHRSYPTVLDAIADNVKPKTLNAFDAFTIHGDKFATSRATHLLLDHLQDSNMGVWNTMKGKDVPENWVKLAPHADEFHKEIPVTDAEGKPQIANQALWVHPAVARAMRPITDPDYMHVVKGFTNMRARQSLLKQANLSLSLFHARALNIMALGNMGPTGWARGLKADRDSPEFEKAERDMVMHGGTSPIQGKNVEAYKSLSPGSIPTWGEVWRHAPVLAEVDKAAQAISHVTFDNFQRKFKVTDYQIHAAGWMADHPDATPQEIHDAKTSIAKQVNAVYGGLNWERLGINHASIEVARAIVLAPDWSFSNIFNVKYALEGDTPAGKLARAFWIRTILGGLAATQLMSLMFTGKPSKKLTQVYMGKDRRGKDIHQNLFFAGAPQDATSLIDNVSDYGAFVGTARTMANKSAPGLHVGMDLMKNEDFLGRPIVKKGMHPVASTVRGGLYLARGLAPVPYSMQNMKDMLVGPGSENFKWWEAPSTLFSGSPPRHSAPERTKTQRSTWDEITTGKL